MSYPYVLYDMVPCKGISSDKTVVFSQEVSCVFDGLIISNQSSSPVLVNADISRTENLNTTSYPLFSNFSLGAFEVIDWLQMKTLTLRADDVLHFWTDDISHIVNVFVSFRALMELP